MNDIHILQNLRKSSALIYFDSLVIWSVYLNDFEGRLIEKLGQLSVWTFVSLDILEQPF